MRSAIVVIGILHCVLSSAAMQADGDLRRDDIVGLDRQRSDSDLTQFYFSLADLSLEDQRAEMWALPSKTKAALWRYNIERYLRNHPELSAEGREILRDGIQLVTMPAWLEIVPGAFGYEQKLSALAEFKLRLQMLPPQTVYEVFIRLGPEPDSISLETETPPLPDSSIRAIPRSEKYACYCSGDWECLSSGSFHCYSSWCDWVVHCGLFNNEVCTGTCKRDDL